MSTKNVPSADGEVFESVGLAHIPSPKAPVSSLYKTNVKKKDGNDYVLDDGDGIDPVTAFEVFSGKIFPTSSDSNRVSNRPNNAPMSTIVETPLQRLTRLQMEISELESDLKSTSLSTEEKDGAAPTSEEMLKVARNLAFRLDAASQISPNRIDSSGKVQTELTGVVMRELERLQSKVSANDAKPSASATDLAAVTYELYASGDGKIGGAGSSDYNTLSIEERLATVEKFVGNSSSVVAAKGTVMERLEQAEGMASKVDTEILEAAAAKAKVIRADLEAANKARSKLTSSMLLAGHSAGEDAKVISSLHEQMTDIEGVSSQLPAIVQRLQQLSQLHGQAADFSTRLAAVESMARDSERLVASLEETLDHVEKGSLSNLKIIEKNMKTLDEKMKKIGSAK
mmetsp:Transcript_59652/g.69714  ORF Transcript_59652/g.69714 Transcript_59652/m.69714 type:complete len:399 (-) Transcript_59652:241-1437(-)|eukprot:CAMPEP_0194377208 /NCGR_PEP_ID=MMETSP0174-20130528/30138_1 /TAXON_ID=216777 /ORGANISM="Proboscia alata, Strain PI-D3" /LENGTH=398 /DNA_ID=CAMNT_0039158411 /DNA_START=30 /DNA_END=1226 /DNA_ORIENTATION=-